MVFFPSYKMMNDVADVYKRQITGRALKQNIISLNTVNIRDFAHNKHNKVDDYT